MKRIAILLTCLLVPLAGAAPSPRPEVTVTDAMVVKYIDFQRRTLKVASQALKKLNAHPGRAKRSSGGQDALKRSEELDKVVDSATERIRQEVGLSAPELNAVQELVNAVMAPRTSWRMSGGDKQLEAMRRDLERSTGATREQMDKQLQAMEANMARMRDAADARAVHGDQAVDLVLKHDGELAQLQQQSLKIGLMRFVQ